MQDIYQEYATTLEAAVLLKRTDRTVRRYIRHGLLRAVTIGGAYLIPRDELAQFCPPLPGNPNFRRRKSKTGRNL